MTNYWAINKELCKGIPWIEIMERCDWLFHSRGVVRGFGPKPVTRWISNFADQRFVAATGSENGTCTFHDFDEKTNLPHAASSRLSMQKQEFITEFMAGGDPEAAHMIIKSWNSTVEDEIAKYMPGGVQANHDFKIDIDDEMANDPSIKASVAEKVSKALIQEHVDRLVRAIEYKAEGELTASWSLDEFLSRQFAETGFIVDRLMKYGANVHLVAAAKTGKTNVAINLVRALADGGKFLGVFETKPINGRICMMDFELDERQAQEWLKRIGIKNSSKVEIYPLRGRPNPFRSPEAMRELEEVLKALEIEFLILDPFSSIYSGDANSNTEVKAFLKEIDAFKLRSGVQHLVIAVHAGRNQGQTRGASTLDDHPDALWYLQKAEEKRYFKAVGRDIDVAEAEINFDPSTGEITFLEFAKKADPLRAMMVKILRYVRANSGCNATALESGVRGGNTYKTQARKDLVESGALIEVPGLGGSKSYQLGEIPFDLLVQL
jgi:hypothetical protein